MVVKVANAYELLGLLEEKERILEKYNNLFTEKKNIKGSSKKKKKPGKISQVIIYFDM